MFLKKMSTRNMGCDTQPVKKLQHGTVVALAAIAGVATSIKTGENRTTGEPWSALLGNFQGVNIQEGTEDFNKVYESATLFLPGGIQEYIESAVRESNGAAVEFAVKISAVTDDDKRNQFGFRYQVENLKKPTTQDNLSGVRSLIQGFTTAQLAIAPPAPPLHPDPIEIEVPASTEPEKEAQGESAETSATTQPAATAKPVGAARKRS